MKKVIICSVLSLFIGGMANASSVKRIENKSIMINNISLDDNGEIIGRGHDGGGYYVIISTDSQCVKVYIRGNFDHMEN
jgi:hypothetical protein